MDPLIFFQTQKLNKYETTRQKIEMEQMYEYIKKLGSGAYGGSHLYLFTFPEVHLAREVVSKKKVAIKKMHKSKTTSKGFNQEKSCLEKVKDCDGAITMLDHFEDEEAFFFVFEYIQGEDLLSHLVGRNAPLKEDQAKILFKNFCLTMQSVHNNHVIHHGNACVVTQNL